LLNGPFWHIGRWAYDSRSFIFSPSFVLLTRPINNYVGLQQWAFCGLAKLKWCDWELAQFPRMQPTKIQFLNFRIIICPQEHAKTENATYLHTWI
jgi:hypothetical protein